MAPSSSSFPILATLAFLGLGPLAGCGEKDTVDTAPEEDSDTAGISDDIVYDDADEDSIMDFHEGNETDDADSDGTPNYLDKDSDGDGVKDKTEAGDNNPLTLPIDSDGDGIQDFLDVDSDNNGLGDADERGDDSAPIDTDGDGVQDFRDTDNDGDGILDEVEVGDASAPRDSDGDRTPDYMDTDSDADGVADIWEAGTTTWQTEPKDSDGDGIADYMDSDSDDDGIPDSAETDNPDGSTEPRDTDEDGKYDCEDTDADGDGLGDWDEANVYGTAVYDSDSDGDGNSDGAEVAVGTDPLNPASKVAGIYVTVPERSEVESAFEFELTISKGDIAFIIDTTCSMSGTANAMASEFSTMVNEIQATIENAAYGYATHDDFNCCGYGSGADKPFELHQQITTEVSLVQSALGATRIHSGDDGTESSTEALYQGATGAGYDMNCDGRLDSSDDVPPFIASSSDPFGGTGGESYDPSTPDAGTIGGFGFREYALPIIVYATDNKMRDPDAGYRTPGGCPIDASNTNVADAMNHIGGYLIGVNTNTSMTVSQMTDLASRTGSYADTDGDGAADDPLVFTWFGSDAEFRDTVVTAIEQLVSGLSFERVELLVEGDDYGFVTNIEPAYYADLDPSDSGSFLEFTLTFRGVVAATTEDQIFKLTLFVVGDGTTMLDSYDILVVVPGNSY